LRKFEFYKLDVFTDNAFSGNQLAVFPNGLELSDEEMQSIANEMNLSETVFVLPSEKALRRLRIFTPQQELPLAGHPVVGTWNLLAHLNIVENLSGEMLEIKQELNLGVLPVEIDFRNKDKIKVTMTQDEFFHGQVITDENEITNLAKGLGLERSDITNTNNLPIQIVSTGIKALDVPVKNLEKLRKCQINAGLLSKIYLKYGAVGCYAFTFETLEEDSAVHARFFAPADSIPEDPATGSAAGSLSGYLIHHGAIPVNKFIIEQGDFMKRRSRIFAEVEGNKGNVTKVKIGGYSVIMARGEIFLD
jgi:trans-2,3-dihydro-3-hydroxyanthranilate isomerase